MKRYLTLFTTLFVFSLKSMATYRVNLIFKLLYGPAYIGVLFTILLIAYHQTDTLAGWNRQEAILLFSVFNLIYTNCMILFMSSIRHLLWTGIRHGEVDQWLIKPGSTQFYLTFTRPNTDLLGLWIIIFSIFVWQLITLPAISLVSAVGFVIMFFVAHLIVYYSLSIYATLGFFFTRAQQIVEVYDKGTDFAQYPLGIFPNSIQMFLSTFLPIAYFSYIPTLFLRGEGSVRHMITAGTLLAVLIAINSFAWKYALRNYSSASS